MHGGDIQAIKDYAQAGQVRFYLKMSKISTTFRILHCVTLNWGFAFELTQFLQGGYCEVSGRELAFSQNPIRFVPRDWFVSDSLFPFPSSFPAKKLQMEGKLNYVIASSKTFGKYFQILSHSQLTNIHLLTTLSTSVLPLFASSPLLIAILKLRELLIFNKQFS